jgi:hypothetical protein
MQSFINNPQQSLLLVLPPFFFLFAIGLGEPLSKASSGQAPDE